MFRPSIKSPITMVGLALIALLLYVVSESSRVRVKAPYYEEKLAAARQMHQAMEILRDHRAAKGVFFTEELGDPLAVTLIGQKYSMITTEEGLLASKLTALNPNFAGALVEMLKQARVKPGDKIAVTATGSFPGLNLALFSACKVLQLQPVLITSLGSSSWGANEEDFTWLDMEKVLNDAGMFNFKSVATSLGGGGDVGFGLSQMGKQLLRDAASRNGIPLIEEKEVNASISARMKIYGNPEQYKVFLNIGGGIAALGHTLNGDIIPAGFNQHLPSTNYPRIGVINLFGEEIPVIHLLNLERLGAQYDLPLAPNPLPPLGIGRVFYETRYNLWVTMVSLLIIALSLAIVFRLDKKVFRFAEAGVEPDALL